MNLIAVESYFGTENAHWPEGKKSPIVHQTILQYEDRTLLPLDNLSSMTAIFCVLKK